MKTMQLLMVLVVLAGLMSCSHDPNPLDVGSGSLEIQPQVRLSKSVSIAEIHRAEVQVSGSGVKGNPVFPLVIDQSNRKLYGKILLPEGVVACALVARLYDTQDRKIGQGEYAMQVEHISLGRFVTPTLDILSAKPRIDTIYASEGSVGINDAIALRAAASDNFGGTIQKYEWKFGSSAWIETNTGDTNIIAPSTAKAYVCSLRVTDDDGNSTYAAITVTVETRPPVAVVSGDTVIYVNEEVNLRGSGSYDETEIVQFAWKIGNADWTVVSTGDTTITTPRTEQALVCSLRVTDDDGNVAFGEVLVLTGATSIDDADGNTYNVIIIGNQFWTVENLRTTKYNDETAIPHVTDGSQWSILSTPEYCWYDNTTDPAEQEKWGALYNWYVVDPANPKKIAPDGWRVPTDADWTALENYLIANGYNYDGTTEGNKIAKAMATQTDWDSSAGTGIIGNDLAKNNASGFSALPGGYSDGYFSHRSSFGFWWSATQRDASGALSRILGFNDERLGRYYHAEGCGFSVRLVRDID